MIHLLWYVFPQEMIKKLAKVSSPQYTANEEQKHTQAGGVEYFGQ